MHGFYKRRPLAILAAVGLLAASGCDDILRVENPGVIDDADLADTFFVPSMTAAAVADFQRQYSSMVHFGTILSDEAVTGHNFTQWEEIDLRIIREDNSQLFDLYQPLQRARHTGDNMAARLKELVPNPQADLNVALVLAYAGYSYTYLGEYFCYSPIAANQPAVWSDEILRNAVTRFEEAIAIGNAAKAAGTPAARADSIINLARVGAARASLQLGDKAKAIGFAAPVPANFVNWVYHTTSPTYLQNVFAANTTGTNRNLGVDVAFRNLNDPRVRHSATAGTGHNQKTQLWTPFQSPSFSGWTGTTNATFTQSTNMRLASGLEARYIVAEAEGLNAANVEFVNSRRAIGGAAPLVAPTEAEYMAALRDQRRRDFFMDGHRLGDLRRYKKFYNIDEFPRGPHPNDAAWDWGNYSDAECFIPHRNERVGNSAYTGPPA